jgi:hypothetical protein
LIFVILDPNEGTVYVFQELEAAKTTFQNILTSFKTMNFALAYYGLGRVHLRQNRSVNFK